MYFSKRALLGEPGSSIEIEVPVGVVVQNDAGKVLGMCYRPYYTYIITKQKKNHDTIFVTDRYHVCAFILLYHLVHFHCAIS